MFRSYLRASIRILSKERLYTIINAVGLAIGLATCFLIYLWIHFETSYDTHFQHCDKIFRVVTNFDNATEEGIASTYPMVKTRILSQVPEIVESARIYDRGFLGSKTQITYEGSVFTDNVFYYGDSTILKIFPFKVVKGNVINPLHKPNSVVVTQQTAEKIFGDVDPIGHTIVMGTDKEFEVTGVIENVPVNTHFHFDMLASMQAHPWIKSAETNVWSGVVFHTYVRLQAGASAMEVENKIANLLDNFPGDTEHVGKEHDLRLQSIEDIHLKSDMKFELGQNGNIKYIYLFLTIAALVLIVAIINYTNLATARHTQRLKEVAVRKVLGASRGQLVSQFLTESLLITIIAFILAAIIVTLTQPVFNSLTGQNYLLRDFLQPELLLVASSIILMIGILTGLAPALTLSAFRPSNLFKVNVSSASEKVTIRKVLIVIQFTVGIALTVCTAITYKQVTYMRDASLGYDMEQTIVLNIGFKEVHEKYVSLKSELLTNPSILGATATSQLPTDVHTGENIDITSTHYLGVNCMSVDPDFFRVMGIEVRKGEELISSIKVSDTINYFVVNESAMKSIGWTENSALRKQMSIRHGNQRPGPVMGVVSDFHFQSLHHTITPLVLEFNPNSYQYLLIKVKPNNLGQTIKFIENKWADISDGVPFDYMFLDQQYDRLYKNELQSGNLFIAFSIVAVFISLLGLFGLSSFAVERRTREIGLRKILGANVTDVLLVISKDFIVLLIISFVFALPIGYYFMDTWLANFAFRTKVGPGLFLLAGLANIVLGLITLAYHGLRISETNPVETLRCE